MKRLPLLSLTLVPCLFLASPTTQAGVASETGEIIVRKVTGQAGKEAAEAAEKQLARQAAASLEESRLARQADDTGKHIAGEADRKLDELRVGAGIGAGAAGIGVGIGAAAAGKGVQDGIDNVTKEAPHTIVLTLTGLALAVLLFFGWRYLNVRPQTP